MRIICCIQLSCLISLLQSGTVLLSLTLMTLTTFLITGQFFQKISFTLSLMTVPHDYLHIFDRNTTGVLCSSFLLLHPARWHMISICPITSGAHLDHLTKVMSTRHCQSYSFSLCNSCHLSSLISHHSFQPLVLYYPGTSHMQQLRTEMQFQGFPLKVFHLT